MYYEPPDFIRDRIGVREREFIQWVNGRMGRPGPRQITGRRREHVVSRQGWACADPYHCCPLRGERFFQDPETGKYIFEIDHIVPWHVRPDSSAPNLQALCLICHAMKTAREVAASVIQLYSRKS